MTNYNNGKIYKIESSLGDKVYYGSTTKKYLSQRMTAHRTDYNRWLIGKTHLIMVFKLFEEYGLENCKIVLIENYPCESKDELHAREAHYIKSFECVNKCVPCRTGKERYEDNKDKILKQVKKYREDNRDKILVKNKQYYKNNRNKILEYQSEYRENNRNKISEYMIQYAKANKDKISERKKIKYTCICGSCICKSDKARHERSNKHIKFLESQ